MKPFLLASLLLLLAPCLGLCSKTIEVPESPLLQSPQDLSKHLTLGQKLYDAKQYKTLIPFLKKLRQQNPIAPDIHRLLGHAYYQENDLQSARVSLVEAIANGRLSLDIFSRLAQIDEKKGDDLALSSSLSFLSLMEPQNVDWHLASARVLARMGEVGKASKSYEKAQEIAPENVNLLLAHAEFEAQQKEFVKAALLLERAWYLGAPYPKLTEKIAELWYQAGHSREALSWYGRTPVHEQSDKAQFQYAFALFEEEGLDQAKSLLTRLLDTKERAVLLKVHLLLGRIEMLLKNEEQAIKHWEAALEAEGSTADILKFLSRYHFSTHNHEKASVYFEKLAQVEGHLTKEMQQNFILSLLKAQKHDAAMLQAQEYLEVYGIDDQLRALLAEAQSL